MDTALEILKLHGPIGLILAYFVWSEYARRIEDRRREKTLGERLDKIVDEHNKLTESVILNNTAAMLELRLEFKRFSDTQWASIHAGVEKRQGRSSNG